MPTSARETELAVTQAHDTVKTQATVSRLRPRCSHHGPRGAATFISEPWMQKPRLARVAAAQKLRVAVSQILWRRGAHGA